MLIVMTHITHIQCERQFVFCNPFCTRFTEEKKKKNEQIALIYSVNAATSTLLGIFLSGHSISMKKIKCKATIGTLCYDKTCLRFYTASFENFRNCLIREQQWLK